MDGLILFADDDVLTADSLENDLFNKFKKDGHYSVLPITNLEDLDKTIQSVSTFRALILDWSFKKTKKDGDLPDINETPLEILKKQRIYSLVYIFSRNDVGDDIKRELLDLYGENRIFFKTKGIESDIDKEFNNITVDINNFESKNSQMEIPFIWSHAINCAVQTIFRELENSSINWIKGIKDAVEEDNGEPISGVIGVFNNLLNELLVQDETLRTTLKGCKGTGTQDTLINIAKLYRRIYYSKLTKTAPLMTGDIFKFNDDEYGILITPECNLVHKAKKFYEFLVVKRKYSLDRQIEEQEKYKNSKEAKKRQNARKVFSNGVESQHLLISFPFDEDKYDCVAFIDFPNAFLTKDDEIDGNKLLSFRTNYKLNAPYIHQLRQRFLSHFGRYGVPAIPDILQEYNLENSDDVLENE